MDRMRELGMVGPRAALARGHVGPIERIGRGFLLLLLLGFGAGCSSWTVERSVVIEAPPATVWEILIDLPGYESWNTYSPRAEGSMREGGIVTIDAQLGEEVQVVDNRVTKFVPGEVLCWHSMNWYEFLARGTRCRFLEPVGVGATRFRHHEIMEGPLAWLIEEIYRPRIEAGLVQMNGDLKRAAEDTGR
jgi:uncharacterized protein YndB with AHSA1/START domain